MTTKSLVQRICISIIIILSGLVITLRQFGIATGVIPPWYTIAFISLSLISLIIGIINRVDTYYYLAFTMGGLFVATTVAYRVASYSILSTWPIILIALGIGVIVAQIINKKSRLKATIGGGLVVIFVPILIGLWTDTWQYIAPIMLILSGFFLIVYSFHTKSKSDKGKQVKGDYYVRPSSEQIDNNIKECDNDEKSNTTN